ncbi:MAG: N-acetyl-gamma-glutamyl-phosphate reductase [Fimbriimonadaceae bacterium]|nr:N-acetyl-gamma-glutamyl-phosphate reductase [Fimbriimonadaceae bacterium]
MDPSLLRALVVGGTGYTGSEVVRLLLDHRRIGALAATSERQVGRPLRESCPWLATDLVLESFDPERVDVDVVFLCQSNGFAMRHAPRLLERTRVVDLSADFRLRDPSLYPIWYGFEHACPDLSPSPVYGLPELGDKAEIGKARLVANPGCYVTASLLALVPLQNAGLIDGIPIIDAKSGVSGAGRSKAETEFLLAELDGGMKAYGLAGHRHTPEIEQELGRPVRFTPHLLPFARGIHATIHVPLRPGLTDEDVRATWRAQYDGAPFVTVRESGFPSTKEALGSNRCVLAAAYDARTGLATLVSVLDNLVKGAAGQAVQNMNLMFGFGETEGLTAHGVWP